MSPSISWVQPVRRPPPVTHPFLSDGDEIVIWSTAEQRWCFHEPQCRWVEKILPENFASSDTTPLPVEREPCKVCWPVRPADALELPSLFEHMS